MLVAIIQARMGSTRLPGKVLLPLADTTVLGLTIRRVRMARSIAKVLVATSDKPEDEKIAQFCEQNNTEYFRGSLPDVLDRYYNAARAADADIICRVTADCPLIDPAVIDEVAEEYAKRECDYASTGRLRSTFPDGMDTEIFSFKALERAWKEATLPSEREHVTPYIWNHPDAFRVREVLHVPDLGHVRLTVDEQSDYMVVRRIVEQAQTLTLDGIVAFLDAHPDVASLNQGIGRDEGYAKSVKQEA